MEYTDTLISQANQVRKQTAPMDLVRDAEKLVISLGSWSAPPGPYTMARAIWSNAIFESSILAESSYFLALHGLYDQACIILRSLLDFFLNEIYWDIQMKYRQQEQGRIDVYPVTNEKGINYLEWVAGNTNQFPRRNEIWELLRKEENIKNYDGNYQLELDYSNALAALDKFAHWRPVSRYAAGGEGRSSRINVRFNEKSLDEWYQYLKKTCCLVSVLSILEYPELLNNKAAIEFTDREPETADRLKKTISPVDS